MGIQIAAMLSLVMREDQMHLKDPKMLAFFAMVWIMDFINMETYSSFLFMFPALSQSDIRDEEFHGIRLEVRRVLLRTSISMYLHQKMMIVHQVTQSSRTQLKPNS